MKNVRADNRTAQEVVDIWYSKPRLFQTVGHWRCKSYAPDEWMAVGVGDTPKDAYDNMKRIIYFRYSGRMEFAC